MIYKRNTNQKKAETVWEKTEMEVGSISKNKKSHFIIIKGTTH